MMTEEDNSSFVDQIISQTIALLSERDEFDERDLERLELLLRSAGAASYRNVIDVLSTKEEEAS